MPQYVDGRRYSKININKMAFNEFFSIQSSCNFEESAFDLERKKSCQDSMHVIFHKNRSIQNLALPKAFLSINDKKLFIVDI